MESVVAAVSTYLTGLTVYHTSRIGHGDDGGFFVICRREAWLEGLCRLRSGGGGKEVVGSWFRRGWKAVVSVSEPETRKKGESAERKRKSSLLRRAQMSEIKAKTEAETDSVQAAFLHTFFFFFLRACFRWWTLMEERRESQLGRGEDKMGAGPGRWDAFFFF